MSSINSNFEILFKQFEENLDISFNAKIPSVKTIEKKEVNYIPALSMNDRLDIIKNILVRYNELRNPNDKSSIGVEKIYTLVPHLFEIDNGCIIDIYQRAFTSKEEKIAFQKKYFTQCELRTWQDDLVFISKLIDQLMINKPKEIPELSNVLSYSRDKRVTEYNWFNIQITNIYSKYRTFTNNDFSNNVYELYNALMSSEVNFQ